MVSLAQVEQQLERIGCNFRFWGRPEIRELPNILLPSETIQKVVNGRYAGGFAMLVVTDHRLLLLDKRLMTFTLEDIGFDMISEIDYGMHLFEGIIHIITPNRKLSFSSWNQKRLRELLNYTQHCVTEMRQHFLAQVTQQRFQTQLDQQQLAADMMGELALQGGGGYQIQPGLPMNPYTKLPSLSRRRRYPRFY